VSANTTVWLVRYTTGGVQRATVSLHNSVADYRRTYPDATSTPIDCAAVEELVAAAQDVDRWVETRPAVHPFDAWRRLRAALARFGSVS
jgi:hypothetical protein